MSPLLHHQVFQSMASSPNARLERCTELGDGLAAAQWSNHHDARDYEGPSHHTLSCYLAGGTGTFRREQSGNKGAPDKLCILPAEHQSAWVINGEIQLAHLYVEQELFALGAVALLDREPRSLQLAEATFLEDAEQSARFRQLCTLDWQEPGERLLSAICWQRLLIATRLCENLRLCIATAQSCAHSFLPRGFVDAPGYPPTPPGRLALGIRRR